MDNQGKVNEEGLERKLPNHPDSPQLLNKAEELAKIINSKKELYRDSEAWYTHQQLSKILKKIILTDLDYALDRKVEQLLWNSCFKNYISHLQSKSKDKRAKDRDTAQISLSAFLENGSGFYILLLEEIRLAFNLSVPFLQTGSPYGTSHGHKVEDKSKKPSKASCNYICQHCLVHLGDIARYRNHIQQAETFYRHAISMAPSSGQPYNQIAILEASRSNKLSTVYFYVRAVSLSFPFPAAFINLGKLLGRLAGLGDGEDRELRDRSAKVTQHTFIPLFLRIQGLLHHASHLRQCVRWCGLLTESLTSLVSTDSLSTWQLLQMIAINMWVWDQAKGDGQKEELSREERLSMGVCADLQASILSSTLLPVYTVKKGEKLLDYYALPALRILLEWIVLHPSALSERGFVLRPQIWPGLACLLNEIEVMLADFDESGLQDFPLPEEYDLQAFKPLLPSMAKFNYKLVNNGQITQHQELPLIRFTRILELGNILAKEPFNLLKKDGEWRAIEKEQQQVEDLDELAASLEAERGDAESSEDEEDSMSIQWEEQNDTSSKGILKTKSKESEPAAPGGGPRYRSRQNVAMAAILRANQTQAPQEAEEDKERRVMFRTPSPSQQSSQDSTESGRLAANPAAKVNFAGKGGVAMKPGPVPVKVADMKPPVSQMSVREFDFSKPPPSLHSNYRPPQLTTSPDHVSKADNVNVEGSLKGINPLPGPLQPQMKSGPQPHHPLLPPEPVPQPHHPLLPPGPPGPGPQFHPGNPSLLGLQAGQFQGAAFPGEGNTAFASNQSGLGLSNIIRQKPGLGVGDQFPPLSGDLNTGTLDYRTGSSSFQPNSGFPNLAGLNLGWSQRSSELFPQDPSLAYKPENLASGLNAGDTKQPLGVGGVFNFGLGDAGFGAPEPGGATGRPENSPGVQQTNENTPTYSLFSGSSWTSSLLSGVDSSQTSSQLSSPSLSLGAYPSNKSSPGPNLGGTFSSPLSSPGQALTGTPPPAHTLFSRSSLGAAGHDGANSPRPPASPLERFLKDNGKNS